jgi:hypothetical protein
MDLEALGTEGYPNACEVWLLEGRLAGPLDVCPCWGESDTGILEE